MKNQDHGSNVFVFTETITPKENRGDDILELAKRSAATLQGQPGMIQTMVTQSEKKSGEIVTITIWNSKDDFQNFMKTDEVAALLKSDDMANIKEWMSDYNMLMSNYVDGWHG